MNNKGSLFLGIVMGVMIFASGMLFMNYVLPDIDTARIALNCNDLTISDGAKVTCLGTDIIVPYLILIIISASGGAIMSKLTL